MVATGVSLEWTQAVMITYTRLMRVPNLTRREMEATPNKQFSITINGGDNVINIHTGNNELVDETIDSDLEESTTNV